MTTRSKTPTYSRRYDKLRRAYDYRATVDGAATRRKLEALQAIGWSLTDIGRATGRTQQSLSVTFHDTRRQVHRDTVKAVAEVYDRWHMRPRDDAYGRRTRLRAARLGYRAPMFYDDIEEGL